jgi:plasmid stabilization system protein ParE
LKTLRLTADAVGDVQAAHDYYEAAKEDLGAAFVDRVEEALRKIQRNPELPQEIAPGLRHMRLKSSTPMRFGISLQRRSWFWVASMGNATFLGLSVTAGKFWNRETRSLDCRHSESRKLSTKA